ncbi:MAG TPA: hypothetical protein VF555_20630 [Variovorax sp.]
MRLTTSRAHLACALLVVACALSACGGSGGGGLPVIGTPDTTTPTPPDTGAKVEKRCAP